MKKLSGQIPMAKFTGEDILVGVGEFEEMFLKIKNILGNSWGSKSGKLYSMNYAVYDGGNYTNGSCQDVSLAEKVLTYKTCSYRTQYDCEFIDSNFVKISEEELKARLL